jgi:serine/threonine-protein kinase
VHRDVSPSNLLVSFEGEVKVCDFGIARANDRLSVRSSQHEIDEAVRGKAGYMSPEHARGESIDARADVYATGIVLWELAAGRRMYRTGEGRDSLLEQARRAEIPPLPDSGLPDAGRLQEIVTKALASDRSARYANAASMLRDLEGYAVSARLMTSPLQLGDWLERTFGEEIVAKRRSRERAAAALEKGAPVVVQALSLEAPAAASAPPAPTTPVPPPVAKPPQATPIPPPAVSVPTPALPAARRSPARAIVFAGVVVLAAAAAAAAVAAHVLH